MQAQCRLSKLALNLAIFVLVFAQGYYFTSYEYIAADIAKDIGLSNSLYGLMSGIFYAGAVIFTVILGELGDRIGKKKAILIGVALFAIGTILIAVLNNGFLLLLSLFLLGSGFGICEGLSRSIVTDENGDGSKYLAKISVCFGVSSIIAPILTTEVLIPFFGIGWRSLFYVIFAMLIVVFFWLYACKFGAPKPISAETKKGVIVFKLLKQPFFLMMAILMFMYLGMETIVGFWITKYFEGAGERISYLSLAILWLGMILSRTAMIFVKPAQRKPFYFIVLGITAIGMLGACLMTSVEGEMAMIGITGIGLGPQWPIIVTYISEKYQQIRGSAIGALMTWSYLGGVIIPLITGFLTDSALGNVFAFVVVIAIALFNVCLYSLSMRRLAHETGASFEIGGELKPTLR